MGGRVAPSRIVGMRCLARKIYVGAICALGIAEIIGEIELGGGIRLDANLAAVQRQCGVNIARTRGHEALA
jgi:hypothetical protein